MFKEVFKSKNKKNIMRFKNAKIITPKFKSTKESGATIRRMAATAQTIRNVIESAVGDNEDAGAPLHL